MTVTTTHNRIEYTGTLGQTVFPYDFLILAAAEILVFKDGVVRPTTEYAVSGVGVGSGGNVTFHVAMAGGEAIILLRRTNLTQQVDLLEGSKLPSDPTEGMWDKLHLITQDLAEEISRAVQVPLTSESIGVELPDPDDPDNQDKAIFINGSGQLEMREILGTDIASPITVKGDLIQGADDGTPEKLAVGAEGQTLTVVSGKAAWATSGSDDIPGTIFDAKGDLLSASAADTPVRVPVGSNGQLLAADSAQAAGLDWIDAHSLPGADYWEFDHSEPPLPASGKGILFTSAFFDGLRRPRWLDAGGHTLDLSGVLLRYLGNPYKEVVSTAAQTSMFATPPTIKGSTLGIERSLGITIIGDYLNNTGAGDAFTLRIKYGGVTVLTLDLPDFTASATRYGWAAHAWISAAGATGAQIAHGFSRASATAGVAGTSVPLNTTQVSTHSGLTVDSTADQTLDITIQNDTSSASSSCRVFAVLIECM